MGKYDHLLNDDWQKMCKTCERFESCEANNELTGSWMDLHVCDDYIDLYGRERELPDDRTVEDTNN